MEEQRGALPLTSRSPIVSVTGSIVRIHHARSTRGMFRSAAMCAALGDAWDYFAQEEHTALLCSCAKGFLSSKWGRKTNPNGEDRPVLFFFHVSQHTGTLTPEMHLMSGSLATDN